MKGFLVYLISSVEALQALNQSWHFISFIFYVKKSTLTMELKSVTNDTWGLLIFEASRCFVF